MDLLLSEVIYNSITAEYVLWINYLAPALSPLISYPDVSTIADADVTEYIHADADSGADADPNAGADAALCPKILNNESNIAHSSADADADAYACVHLHVDADAH